MADNPQKPKRDLRARLGRTITPKTAGADDAAAPPDLGETAPSAAVAADPAPAAEPEAAPPAAAAPKPARTLKSPAAKPAGGGIAAPPAAIAGPPPGIAGPPGIAAPPFATPDVAPPPFAQPSAPELPPDPFGAPAVATQAQVVRLEFDDKLVTDQEVGKTQRLRTLLIAVLVLVVGVAVGWGAGSLLAERQLFQRNVADARSIRGSVDEAARTVNSAQTHINAMFQAARGDQANGVAPRVDYDAINALRALQKPWDASRFIGKNYNALPPETVNDLMVYTLNVERLWTDFGALAAETLPEGRRAELDRTAQETGEAAATQYGLVLQRTAEGQLGGSLAFLQVEQGENNTTRIMGRLTRSGAAREFQLFTGTEEIGTTQTHVLLIDGAASRGVLAEQTGAFGRYVQRLVELKTLIEQTLEVQGRLLQAIGNALNEVGG
jgi:hypothetical protein